MARVTYIKAAKKSKFTRNCTTCGHSVQPGESYKRLPKKTGPASGYTLIFCYRHSPRSSHFASGREAELSQIVEGLEDTLKEFADDADTDDIQSAIESSLDEIEEFASSLREGADNMEMGFGHTTTRSEAMSETADELDDWREQLNSVAESGSDESQDLIAELQDILAEQPDLNLTG